MLIGTLSMNWPLRIRLTSAAVATVLSITNRTLTLWPRLARAGASIEDSTTSGPPRFASGTTNSSTPLSRATRDSASALPMFSLPSVTSTSRFWALSGKLATAS